MILNKFTTETYLTLWEVGWLKGLDSYRINKEGDIVFFSTYNCDNCNKLLGGPNPIDFNHVDKPYTQKYVEKIFDEIKWKNVNPNISKQFENFYFIRHMHTHRPNVYEETLEPFETTGGYGCYDCKSKLDN